MENKTIVVWFSCGAASAVAAKLTLDKYLNIMLLILCITVLALIGVLIFFKAKRSEEKDRQEKLRPGALFYSDLAKKTVYVRKVKKEGELTFVAFYTRESYREPWSKEKVMKEEEFYKCYVTYGEHLSQ